MKCTRCKCDIPSDEIIPSSKKCHKCRQYWKLYYQKNRKRCIETAKYHLNKDRDKTNTNKRKWWRKNRISTMLTAAKTRAKQKGLPFDITGDDLVIPEICPVLGIPIKIGVGKCTPNSPSLDRFNSELGYVKGNVRIISHKANTIKSNATLSELKLVLKYLEQGLVYKP